MTPPDDLTHDELAEARRMMDQCQQLRMQLGEPDAALIEFALILRTYRRAVPVKAA